MPNSASARPLSAVTGPVTCTSLPSLPASTLSALTETTAPDPSASERAVWTARPSFQNRPMTISTIKSRPKTTPPTARLIRPNHETDVTSRNESLIVAHKVAGNGRPSIAAPANLTGIRRAPIWRARTGPCFSRRKSGRRQHETAAESRSQSIGFDFVKSRLMSDSSAGRLDPNQPVLGGRGDQPKVSSTGIVRHQTRTASRSLNGFGLVGR